ncbi:hypothetical protein N9101_01595 [Akkermansiaceae bacterium]|nr:hypothetical protein [Akkermansiaceae bacterium]
MATFIVGVFFNLYLFAVHPPWMEQIHSFFESDRPEYRKSKWQTKDEVFRSFLAISIANACMSALLWFLGYKVCKFMVKRPLKKAGFGSAALARAGSWVFLIPFSGPAAILGLFMCLGAVTSGTRAPMGPLEFTQPYRNNSGPNIFIPPNKGRRKGI